MIYIIYKKIFRNIKLSIINFIILKVVLGEKYLD